MATARRHKSFRILLFGIGTMIGLALLSSVLAGIESLVHEYHVAMQKKIAAAASKARGGGKEQRRVWKIRSQLQN